MERNKGRIYCCERGRGCKSKAFTLQEMAKHLSIDTLELVSECQKKVLKLQLERENETVVNDRVKQELAILERLSEHEKKVRTARKEIEGSLLVTMCPKCKKPFFDWSECAALTCKDENGNGCGAHFCCYCGKIHEGPGDPHTHVLDCPTAGKKPPGDGSKLYPPRCVCMDVILHQPKRDLMLNVFSSSLSLTNTLVVLYCKVVLRPSDLEAKER